MVSGSVLKTSDEKTEALQQSSLLNDNDSNVNIEFESGFAILEFNNVQIILPKGTKRSYSISEIFDEFDNKDGNVNARYLSYVSEKLIKNNSNPDEDRTTKGVVSRGAQFLQAISPNTNCSIVHENICFNWNTNMALDTLEIHVIDSKLKYAGSAIALPKNMHKIVSKKNLGITSSGQYFWQITKKDEYPSYNAWRTFIIASDEEISEYNNSMKLEGLSEETKNAVLESLSCGCSN